MNPDKYQETYRITSARLAGWDYGSNAAYFITICTQNQVPAFGEVIDGQVNLTSVGQAAWDCWQAIPEHFPFVVLGEFVAMPNHVHGIVLINKPAPKADECNDNVDTQNFAYLRGGINRFGPQSQNLASIVRGFKIGVTKFAQQNQIPFSWQRRYYDHIIRNAEEYERIRKYIIENPQKWEDDCFYAP